MLTVPMQLRKQHRCFACQYVPTSQTDDLTRRFWDRVVHACVYSRNVGHYGCLACGRTWQRGGTRVWWPIRVGWQHKHQVGEQPHWPRVVRWAGGWELRRPGDGVERWHLGWVLRVWRLRVIFGEGR
jgi:hypothetical protein